MTEEDKNVIIKLYEQIPFKLKGDILGFDEKGEEILQKEDERNIFFTLDEL